MSDELYDPELQRWPGPSKEELFYASRNLQLATSDWTQLLDAPLTDEKKAEWAKYRQELRDLPSTKTNKISPHGKDWPVAPGEAVQPHHLASKLPGPMRP
jgi:hypothetical protein